MIYSLVDRVSEYFPIWQKFTEENFIMKQKLKDIRILLLFRFRIIMRWIKLHYICTKNLMTFHAKKSKIYLAVHDLIMCCHGLLNRLVQDRRNVWDMGVGTRQLLADKLTLLQSGGRWGGQIFHRLNSTKFFETPAYFLCDRVWPILKCLQFSRQNIQATIMSSSQMSAILIVTITWLFFVVEILVKIKYVIMSTVWMMSFRQGIKWQI